MFVVARPELGASGIFPALWACRAARLQQQRMHQTGNTIADIRISTSRSTMPALGAAGDKTIASRAARLRSLYPVRTRLRDGTEITIRPIGPEDAEREQSFVRALSAESRYFRFMSALHELSPHTLYRFTHPDFEREIALVALVGTEPAARQIGVARLIAQEDPRRAEFAVVVADAWQTRGVGSRLMCELMRAGQMSGIEIIWGDVLASNHRMLALMNTLGFSIETVADDPLLRRVVKHLGANPSE